MLTEIELKAHVRDAEALKLLLSQKAEYSCEFEKRDVYWFGPSALQLAKVRVRRERRTGAVGDEKTLCLVTYKAKEANGGIEVNDEVEFEVSPAEEFEEFLGKMGYSAGAAKRKHGWVYVKGDLTAELVEVDGLGWFIELEILSPRLDDAVGIGKKEKAISDKSEALLAFLDSLGVEREAIERRYYLDMLTSLRTAGLRCIHIPV